MYPGTFAESTPDKPAIIMAETGTTVSCAELGERSSRLARPPTSSTTAGPGR